jgi:hypothetical protein
MNRRTAALVLIGIDFGLPLAFFVFTRMRTGPKELSKVIDGSSRQV